MTIDKADRALLAELAQLLDVDFRCERRDDRGLSFIAGSRGTVRPTGGALVVILRPAAAAAVDQLLRQLLRTGALSTDGENLVITRLPEGTEIPALMNLVGLRRAWAAPSSRSAPNAIANNTP